MSIGALLRRRLGPARALVSACAAARWSPHSRLLIVPDSLGWSLDWDAKELALTCRRLGVRCRIDEQYARLRNQSVFFCSRYFLMNDDWLQMEHRVALPYYHGLPGSGHREFDACYEGLRRHHDRIARVQVTHTQMRAALLQTGIAADKVRLIPIGVNLNYFPLRTAAGRLEQRRRLGIPETAFCVGSFQKDGEGWQDGNTPKMVKGPDILVDVIARLRKAIPELCVLLSGPARGYVKRRLTQLGVPFRHAYVRHYPDVAQLYQACDLYLVTSRQEGGPKAVLEAMATGVPLVSARVGQAADLIRHGENGWLADVEDVAALVHWAECAHRDAGHLAPVIQAGRRTAEANAYPALDGLWREFMRGFVGQ